ncbi:MAG TPA: hypothetical protein VLR94_08035 [Acidobacteriota bacterium]|nr:hypothetical protein [Acidobacteriota bacterium]
MLTPGDTSMVPGSWQVAQSMLLRTCWECEKFNGCRMAEDQRKYTNIPARAAKTIEVIIRNLRILEL